MEQAFDFRSQAAEWRKAAKRHGGEIGHALEIAADLLEQKAKWLETATPDAGEQANIRPV